MSKDTVSGQDPVPRRFWLLVGGNSLSLPPTWNRLVSMATERNKVRRDAESEKAEFRKAAKKAKQELEAAKRAYKQAYGGGLAAWKQRNREAETNGNEGDGDGDGDGTGREGQRTQETNAGGNEVEAND